MVRAGKGRGRPRPWGAGEVAPFEKAQRLCRERHTDRAEALSGDRTERVPVARPDEHEVTLGEYSALPVDQVGEGALLDLEHLREVVGVRGALEGAADSPSPDVVAILARDVVGEVQHRRLDVIQGQEMPPQEEEISLRNAQAGAVTQLNGGTDDHHHARCPRPVSREGIRDLPRRARLRLIAQADSHIDWLLGRHPTFDRSSWGTGSHATTRSGSGWFPTTVFWTLPNSSSDPTSPCSPPTTSANHHGPAKRCTGTRTVRSGRSTRWTW